MIRHWPYKDLWCGLVRLCMCRNELLPQLIKKHSPSAPESHTFYPFNTNTSRKPQILGFPIVQGQAPLSRPVALLL